MEMESVTSLWVASRSLRRVSLSQVSSFWNANLSWVSEVQVWVKFFLCKSESRVQVQGEFWWVLSLWHASLSQILVVWARVKFQVSGGWVWVRFWVNWTFLYSGITRVFVLLFNYTISWLEEGNCAHLLHLSLTAFIKSQTKCSKSSV